MVQYTYAQNETLNLGTSVKANFGVDADTKSGILSFNTDGLVGDETDDWFLGPKGGLGVIDVSDQATITRLGSGLNIGAEFRMSHPVNTTVNGNFWLDAVYLRDQYSHNNEKDMTVFGGGDDKNFDNPTTWAIKRGSVPPKNDIIDVYGHLRRESTNQANALWLFGAVSTRTQNGDNYLDFEYFRKPVSYTIPSNPNDQGHLMTSGSECGHTAYRFNQVNGEVLVNGDIILSVNYVNGGTVADFRFYVWIDSNEIKGLDGDASSLSNTDFVYYNDNFPLRRFDFGDGNGGYEFYNCDNNSNIPYGYARISLRKNFIAEPIFAQDNTGADVTAPTWGTIGPDGKVNNVYVSPTFIEFGLNATLFGLDSTMSNGICATPLGSVIVKTRASASFTSELKDLAGPFKLGNSQEYAVTISEPAILTCTVNEIILTASVIPSGNYTFEWFKDGQPFDDATPANNTLNVKEPGHYSVNAAHPESCTIQSEVVEVLQNIQEPEVSALGGVLECSTNQIQISGTMSSANPNSELTFQWTGPNNFINNSDLNVIVTLVGTYILTVTDTNNACIGTATAVVTSTSETVLEIECPPTIEVQCLAEIPEPDVNSVTIINSGANGQILVQFVSDVSDFGNCPGIITRTYSATDSCGNVTYCSQNIIVNDTSNPDISDLPDFQLEGCNAPWPEFLTTTWTDNCSSSGSINSDASVEDGSSEDSCIQYRLYTFTMTDDCGNSATETTRVTRAYDMTDPEITDIEDYQLEGCNQEWPQFLSTTWADNCSSGGSINSDAGVDDGSSEDDCVLYRLYTFTITDNCGNSDTETTRVSKELYNSNPEIEDLADYSLEGCNTEWPGFLTTTWTGNCTNGGSIQSDAGVDDGNSEDGCIQYRLYTFTVTDNCGNSNSETTRVSREYDMTNPEITDIEDYQLEGCNQEWPQYLTTTWTDNCASGGTINSNSGVDAGGGEEGCLQYRLYTFLVTDNCGNSNTETTRVSRGYQKITDLTDYQLEGCNTTWPPYLTTELTNNCSDGGKIESDHGVDDGSSEDGCTQYRLYTFTVTDICGNSNTETTRLSREFDMTDPEITDIEDYKLVGCDQEWPQFLTTEWTDNCSSGGSINSDAGVVDGNSEDGCIQYRLYTFTITDNCGNSDTEKTRVSKELYISDPEIEDLADYSLESCNTDWPEFLITTWTGNCTNGGEIESDYGVDDGSIEDGCIQYRLYTFIITDNCGNTATETTRVSREYDMTDPEITDIEDYQLEGCDQEWPQFLTTEWADNCSSGGSINSDEGVVDGNSEDGCIQYRLYTFTITDNCGNSDTETTRVSKELYISDPEIEDLADYSLESCNTDWPEFLISTWTGNCTNGGEIESDHGVDDGSSEDGCIQYRLYTFTITDNCGNTDTETTRVSREYDMTDPEITDIEDYQLEGCNSPWPEYLKTNWTDNCSQGSEIESDHGVDDGSSPDGAVEYRLYTFEVIDNCGNMDIETTLVSRENSNIGRVLGNDIELCRDYGEFNLFFLLPDGYITGGSWSLDSSPEGINLEISDSGSILVFEELPYGDYVFLYHQVSEECLPLIEVTVHLLEDQPPCVLACEFRVTKVTTALTPNGDNVNDTFYSGLVPSESCTVDVLIFNRWGAKIFEAINYENDWKGTVPSNALGSSNMVTTGTYYYILKYKIDGNIEQTVAGYFYVATE